MAVVNSKETDNTVRDNTVIRARTVVVGAPIAPIAWSWYPSLGAPVLVPQCCVLCCSLLFSVVPATCHDIDG